MKTFATVLSFGACLVLGASLMYAKPEYTKKEGGAKCVVCHTAMGKKDLNAVGKCYAEKKDLKGCSAK